MNIADKSFLYAELRRVVRPGGRLAIQEISPAGAARFTCRCRARQPGSSHPASPRRLGGCRSAVARASTPATTFAAPRWPGCERGVAAIDARTTPPFGTHLLMGADARRMVRKQARNSPRIERARFKPGSGNRELSILALD